MDKSNIAICCSLHEAILYSSIRLSNHVGKIYFSADVLSQLKKLDLKSTKFKAQKFNLSLKTLSIFFLYLKFLITHDQTKLAYYEILRRRTPDNTNPNIVHHVASLRDLVYSFFDVTLLLEPKVKTIIINDPIFSKRIVANFLVDYSEKYSLAISVYGCVNSVLYLLSKDRKTGHAFIKDFNTLDELDDEKVDIYYHNRISGSSNYEDANRAFRPTKNTFIYKDAVVMYLHIFRDTPFHTFEKDRIFFEYTDWVFSTVEYCVNNKIKIVLKMHPSAAVWGEDQFAWLYKILGTLMNSIYVHTDNQSSNFYDVFASCKSVVTFSGNVKYEYAMFGKKPLVIMSGQNDFITGKLFTKPKTRADYFSLLHADARPLSEDDVRLAKNVVYYLEAVSPLYAKFDIGTSYRGTSKKQMEEIVSQREILISNHEHGICQFYEATLFD